MTTNWKAFDTSTEAGKLLQQLYGGQMKNPNIEYPKLQPRADAAKQRPKFIPGGAREGASDPRAATKRAANVNVPKMGRHERARPAAIEYVEKRRSGAVIDAQVQDAKMRLECYRPPNVKPFSTDAEKAKVQERFEFGGGRCLPEELTHHAGPLPSEMVAKRKERERVEKAWETRRGGDTQCGAAGAPAAAAGAPNKENSALAEQIMLEIEERQAFLRDMQALGQGKKHERQVASEIAVRMRELEKMGADTGARS